jgi:mannan endo-1,4-beta-mannosidase
MKKTIARIFILLMPLLSACSPGLTKISLQKELCVKLVDSSATIETVYLFYNLKKLSEKKIIFGHHETTSYGLGWRGDPNRSDVKDVIGEFPGLYGWDLGFLSQEGNSDPLKNPARKLAEEAYNRGGINIFCVHQNNPVTGNSFYDTTRAVEKILPGGDCYLRYLALLDKIADYFKSLIDSSGKPIPVIFRPYHEFDGNWFWWGKNFCTISEFKALWRETVTYLRDKKGVRNLIYSFSPDRNFHSKEAYLERYPGDDYVDLLGVDIYFDFTPDGDGLEWVQKKLKIISDLAKEKNKVAAFTETGLEGIPDSHWWTKRLLPVIQGDSINLAFVMVWRNANENHHYAPFKGSISSEDFCNFGAMSKILFEDQLPKLYSQRVSDDTFKMIDREKEIRILKILGSRPLIF